MSKFFVVSFWTSSLGELKDAEQVLFVQRRKRNDLSHFCSLHRGSLSCGYFVLFGIKWVMNSSIRRVFWVDMDFCREEEEESLDHCSFVFMLNQLRGEEQISF